MFRMKNVFTPLMAQTIIKRTMHDRKLPFISDKTIKTNNNIIGTRSELKEDAMRTILKDKDFWDYWKVSNKNNKENDLLHLLPRDK